MEGELEQNGQSSDTSDMINELRNHHVKKLLTKLGGRSVDANIQKAIKRSFSEYAEDIIKGQCNDSTQETEINYNR